MSSTEVVTCQSISKTDLLVVRITRLSLHIILLYSVNLKNLFSFCCILTQMMSINTMSKSFFYLDTLINFAIIRLMPLKKSIIPPQGKNKKPVMALETQVI